MLRAQRWLRVLQVLPLQVLLLELLMQLQVPQGPEGWGPLASSLAACWPEAAAHPAHALPPWLPRRRQQAAQQLAQRQQGLTGLAAQQQGLQRRIGLPPAAGPPATAAAPPTRLHMRAGGRKHRFTRHIHCDM